MNAKTLDILPPAVPSGHHPLDLFPWFARIRPSPLRNFVYTFIFNALLGLVFTALALLFSERIDLGRQLFVTFVFSQCIGYAIYVMMLVFQAVVSTQFRRSAAGRWLCYMVIPVIGVFIGHWIATTILGFHNTRAEMFTVRGISAIAAIAVLIASILIAIFVPRERAMRAQAAAAREEARANAAEKEATLARMQLLEAQVEPHFLYNTLAHVVTLVDRSAGGQAHAAPGDDPRHFWQVHRGTIVNLRQVATTTRDLASRVILHMKSRAEAVPVSRAYAHLFKQM